MSNPPPITPARWLLLAWLALHLFTMTVSMAKDTAFGKTFRPYTDPYQWRVGVHQNWTMYAPNPRMSTTWLEYTGIYEDKTETPLELFIGRPDPNAVQTHYEREGKLERNAVSRKHIRATFVRWYCRKSKEAGKPLRRIRVESVAVHTPPPGDSPPKRVARDAQRPGDVELQALNRLLFEERDARDLAAMRITLGLLLVVWWVMLWPDLGPLFTEAGPVDLRLLETKWSRYRFGPFDGFTEGQLKSVHVLGFGVVLAYLAGYKTRITNALVVFLLAAYWHRSPWAVNGGDRLIRIFAFYMCFAPCGRAWSVDAWLAGTKNATAPVFAIRLIQLQTMVMYTYTGIAKMTGHTWHQGTALYYSLADVGYARFPALTDQLLSYAVVRGLLMPATWVALVWETAFAPLVFFKRTRNATLIVGLIVHAGIFIGLVVGIFSWISVWSYLAFLPAGWAGRLQERLLGKPDVPLDANEEPA